MPLQKIVFKPGVNKENTRYTTEGGWYECDKIRFRQGNPETIGGWVPYSSIGAVFQGICRSMWNWVTLTGRNLLGLGTNLKFYIEEGGAYNDITPIRRTVTLGSNPFAGNNTTTVTVTDTGHGASIGDFVTYSGATGTYDTIFNAEFQIVSIVNANSYTITAPSVISGGSYGGTPVAAYQVGVSGTTELPRVGWGFSTWASGGWGEGSPVTTSTSLGLWTQQNYGEDLVFGPRTGGLYYWDATSGLNTRGVLLNSLGGIVTFTTASPTVVTLSKVLSESTAVQFSVSSGGTLPTGISANTTYYLFNVNGLTANLLNTAGNLVNVTGAGSGTFSISLLVDVPTVQNTIVVSDVNRFVFTLGCNDYGSAVIDPMLVRWSDQDNIYVWTPDATNQAGFLRLSHGSSIIAGVIARQEVVLFTDSSVYSLQYFGPPVVWGSQLLADNVSIAGFNAAVIASGIIYWMGIDKFYFYDGRVQTLNCDLRRHVFGDINTAQYQQIYAGSNEGFNEVWWFYPSANSLYPDRYVIFNYFERAWYYGTMERTAWIDSGLRPNPLATTFDPATQTGRLITHESGINDNTTGVNNPINSYISSSEFDIGDGHNFSFVWRFLPDLTFSNSSSSPTGTPARVSMTLSTLQNSGSGIATTNSNTINLDAPATSSNTEKFTGQVYTRLRGRQMIFKVGSNQVNTAWQLGAPRIDFRADGRR